MDLDSIEKVKYTFSGHDSFQCRQLWLKKGFDFVQEGNSFNDDDAMVRLGVGKNMVSSIRYWLKAFNIVDNKDKPTEFGVKLLDTEDGYDPFLEDDGSLWLLHYQLVKTGIASIYSLIFNEFRKEKIFFTKETFVNYLKRRKESDPMLVFNDNTVNDDFGVFVKIYHSSTSAKDIEDSFSGILSEIELLKVQTSDNSGKGRVEQFQIENSERDNLPEEIFLFSILDNKNYGNSISLSSLESDHNGPGSIFALSRLGLTNKISDIVGDNVTFTDHAGIKEVQFKSKPNAYSILDLYYDK
jgi:hypothetical protein